MIFEGGRYFVPRNICHYIVVDADALKASLAEYLSNCCKMP
jgi:hypothetical protein